MGIDLTAREEQIRKALAEIEARPKPRPWRRGNQEPSMPDADIPIEKTVVVAFLVGDKVRLKGAAADGWGFVAGIDARPQGVVYWVSWPSDRTATQHYDFELEDAE